MPSTILNAWRTPGFKMTTTTTNFWRVLGEVVRIMGLNANSSCILISKCFVLYTPCQQFYFCKN